MTKRTTPVAPRSAPIVRRGDSTKEGSKVAPEVVQDVSKGAVKREWEKGTGILSLFVATGSFYELRKEKQRDKEVKPRPANIILVSQPGRGKTELLERFIPNRNIDFRSDLTVRGLWGILQKSEAGLVTHIGATELQKWFMRKQATADNLFGTLIQAMEEGVDRADVGTKTLRFNHARVGLIAAITSHTLEQKQEYLKEMGFLSRCAMFPWQLPAGEVQDIMRRISDGEVDLSPVRLTLPERPIPVVMPPVISRHLEQYVWESWRHEALRVFMRFRQITMASAVLEGRDEVTEYDISVFHEYDTYWHRMITE